MNDLYRDTIIRRALAPADDVRVPPTLARDIAQLARSTPQDLAQERMVISGRQAPVQLSPATAILLLLAALTSLVIGAALLLSEERGSGDVLNFHGDAGLTGEMDGPGPSGEPVIEWDVPIGRELIWSTMPLVRDGVVYIVDLKGGVLALEQTTGSEVWRSSIGAEAAGTPLITDELLIVGAGDGSAVALALADGSERWRTALSAAAASSLMGWGDLTLIGLADGSLRAIEVATGRERWSVTLSGPVDRAAAIDDGVAYVPVQGAGVAAVDLVTGEPIWRLDSPGHDVGTPAVRDGVLYVSSGVEGTVPYELVAFDTAPLRDGAPPIELWRWQEPTSERLGVGAVAADTVYATSNDGNVYAIDQDDGEARLLLDTGGQVGALATLVGETLYVASTDRHVQAVDRHTGEPEWTVAVPGEPTIPVVSEGRVIVGTNLGRVVSIAEAGQAAEPG